MVHTMHVGIAETDWPSPPTGRIAHQTGRHTDQLTGDHHGFIRVHWTRRGHCSALHRHGDRYCPSTESVQGAGFSHPSTLSLSSIDSSINHQGLSPQSSVFRAPVYKDRVSELAYQHLARLSCPQRSQLITFSELHSWQRTTPEWCIRPGVFLVDLTHVVVPDTRNSAGLWPICFHTAGSLLVLHLRPHLPAPHISCPPVAIGLPLFCDTRGTRQLKVSHEIVVDQRLPPDIL